MPLLEAPLEQLREKIHFVSERELAVAIPHYRHRLQYGDSAERDAVIDAFADLYHRQGRHNIGDCLMQLRGYGDRIAVRDARYLKERDGTVHALPEVVWDYDTLLAETERWAQHLLDQGIRKGDRIGMIAENSPESLAFKYACFMTGAVPVFWAEKEIDAGMTAVEAMNKVGVQFIALQGSTLRFFTEDRGRETPVGKVLTYGKLIPIDGAARLQVDALPAKPWQRPPQLSLGEARRQVELSDPAMITFSSATGSDRAQPIEATHLNWVHHWSTAPTVLQHAAPEICDRSVGGRCLHVLPQHHIFGNMLMDLQLAMGAEMWLSTIPSLRWSKKELLRRVRPEFMAAVPDVWEEIDRSIHAELWKREHALEAEARANVWRKLYLRFVQEIAACIQEVLLRGSVQVAIDERRRLTRQGAHEVLIRSSENYHAPVLQDRERARAYARKPFSEYRNAIGLLGLRFIVKPQAGIDKLEFAINGGAALPARVADIFRAMHVSLVAGSGMTETTSLTSIPHPYGEDPAATAGSLAPGMAGWESDPDEDGQRRLLVAGPGVARYLDDRMNDQYLMGRVLDTGDIGSVIADYRGQLLVTLDGRAKRNITLSTGVKIFPQSHEAALKNSPLIRRAIAVGEGRHSMAFLIVPNRVAARQRFDLTEEQAMGDFNAIPHLREGYEAEVKRLTGRDTLKQRVIIDGFHILDGEELPPELLSRSEKPRFALIENHYHKEINAIYKRREDARRTS